MQQTGREQGNHGENHDVGNMSAPIRSERVIALDKTCELAENSASIFSDLAELTLDPGVAETLRECAEARTQVASELIVARQETGELPAVGKPEKAALQALGMKLGSIVGEPEAMYHKLRELDLELAEAAHESLRLGVEDSVGRVLQSLLSLIDETAGLLDAAS